MRFANNLEEKAQFCQKYGKQDVFFIGKGLQLKHCTHHVEARGQQVGANGVVGHCKQGEGLEPERSGCNKQTAGTYPH